MGQLHLINRRHKNFIEQVIENAKTIWAMKMPTYIEFRDQMLAAGYDEVLERPWAPGTVVPTHTHPFEADAVVVAGEMWLSVRGAPEQHLLPGDRFHLKPNEPHEERYGAAGATYWVARRG